MSLIEEKICVCFSLLLSFLPLFKCFSSSQPIHYNCSDATNYTANSPFSNNLHIMLDSLTKNGSHNGFYNVSKGENPDQVFGLVLCRGNISASDCSSCFNTATRGVIEACPMRKAAIIWYDLCLLRYSNAQFFTSEGFQDMNYYLYTNGSRPYDFKFALVMLLLNLSLQATVDPRKHMEAVGKLDLGLDQHVYGKVQCRRNLSRSGCSECLTAAIFQIPNCCYRKGRPVFRLRCNLWFKFHPNSYLFGPRDSPLPLPSANGDSPSRVTVGDGLSPEYIAFIVIAVTATTMLICITAACLLKRPKKKENHRVSPEVAPDSGSAEPLKFDLDVILAATSRFSDENKIRNVSLGHVYKGKLLDGSELAVKRLSRNSGQSAEQLKNEAVQTARLQHRNLVRLLGYCMEGDEKLLVYEYVSNKSLDNFLNDPTRRGQLGWDTRYMIINGIAQGLLYLHEESPYNIVHPDLKANNIFLDSEFCPKISEFGFTRFSRGQQTAGTHGYMVRENAMHEQFSVKSDVFSFGVLAIEIVSGRKRGDFTQSENAPDVLCHTWKQWIEGKVLELMDPTLVESCSISEVLRCIHVALLCVQEHPTHRPTMHDVNIMLGGKPIHLQPSSPPIFPIGSSVVANHPSS